MAAEEYRVFFFFFQLEQDWDTSQTMSENKNNGIWELEWSNFLNFKTLGSGLRSLKTTELEFTCIDWSERWNKFAVLCATLISKKKKKEWTQVNASARKSRPNEDAIFNFSFWPGLQPDSAIQK